MEPSLVSMIALCIFICFLISPSVSLHFDIPTPYRHHHQVANAESGDDDLLQPVLLPRKLKLAAVETATHEFGEGVSVTYKGKTSSFTGRVYKKGEGRKEKLGEEEDRMSEFMGMDYARVRRRRPIHNKSLHSTAAP